MTDKFDRLREKTRKIVAEGIFLYKRERMPGRYYCKPDCASCLAEEARSNVDRSDGVSFDSDEDVCMHEARDILAKIFNLTIN